MMQTKLIDRINNRNDNTNIIEHIMSNNEIPLSKIKMVNESYSNEHYHVINKSFDKFRKWVRENC